MLDILLNLSIMWTVLVIIFVLVEAFTLNLTAIWLALGALSGLVLSLIGAHIIIQFACFVLVTLLLLFFTRPVVKKHLKVGINKTNVDSLIGMEGIVLDTIEKHQKGLVKVNGQKWSAIAFDSKRIEKDVDVIVMAVEGVKLIVKRSDE